MSRPFSLSTFWSQIPRCSTVMWSSSSTRSWELSGENAKSRPSISCETVSAGRRTVMVWS